MGVNEPKRAFSCKVILQVEVKARVTNRHIPCYFSLVAWQAACNPQISTACWTADVESYQTSQEWIYILHCIKYPATFTTQLLFTNSLDSLGLAWVHKESDLNEKHMLRRYESHPLMSSDMDIWRALYFLTALLSCTWAFLLVLKINIPCPSSCKYEPMQGRRYTIAKNIKRSSLYGSMEQ